MNRNDLHSALRTTVLQEVGDGGVSYKVVRLQKGRNEFMETLHAKPSSFSTAGLQTTDFLNLLGLRRSACAFHGGECYATRIRADIDGQGLAKAVSAAFLKFAGAAGHLEACGVFVDQPEGWGFFYGKPSEGRRASAARSLGNGHVASKLERMKQSEDEFFRYVFTWIEGSGEKGWTTHYRAKHMPLSPEFQSALTFLRGFSWFDQCPEFEFDGCWWRFTPFRPELEDGFHRSADYAHRWFDNHSTHFSAGLKLLLTAHSELTPHGLSFLPMASAHRPIRVPIAGGAVTAPPQGSASTEDLDSFDVALSFAGTERKLAEHLAEQVRDAGFKVFYDAFYQEQLWGKDLVAFFDRVYRKSARYCVMFVSKEYADRMWTNHERRSAQARALEERGREYILPIRIDSTDLEGLPPTVGHVSLEQSDIATITRALVKKLSRTPRS
jgi:hypothetical protein